MTEKSMNSYLSSPPTFKSHIVSHSRFTKFKLSSVSVKSYRLRDSKIKNLKILSFSLLRKMATQIWIFHVNIS